MIVLDFKNGKDACSAADVGKLLDDLFHVLLWQPTRPYAVGMLLGANDAQFSFQLTRDSTQCGVTAKKNRRLALGAPVDAKLAAAAAAVVSQCRCAVLLFTATRAFFTKQAATP